LLFKLAFRNLFRQKRRTFLTLSMMVVGFVIMSFSLALSEGGYDRVISSFTREKTGHIQIFVENFLETPTLFKTLNNVDDFIEKISANKNIIGMTPRIISGGLASISDSTMGAEINGVDFELERKVSTLEKRIRLGQWFTRPGAFEVIIGKKVAEILDAKIGSKMALISQAGDGSTANDNFLVVGILKENPYDDFLVYTELKTAREFFYLPNKAHKLILLLNHYGQSEKVSGELRKEIKGNISVSPWFVVEDEFFRGMSADKKGNYIFYFIVGIMVAIGILNTILMSFLERKREFGILLAIGTRPTFIFSQIMTEGLLLSLFASLIGLPLSLWINYHYSKEGIPLGTKLEFGGIVWDRIVTSLDPLAFTAPTLVLILSTLFVALYPAIMAAKVLPTEGMRAN
jgi:putative ABC transport system permease protein